MKHECNYNATSNTIEAAIHGLSSKAEILKMIHNIVDLCARHESADIIVDYSGSTTGYLSMDDIYDLIHQLTPAKDLLTNRRCAHVAPKDLQFGLIRAWEIMTELEDFIDFHKMVFRNKSEAKKWLKNSS